MFWWPRVLFKPHYLTMEASWCLGIKGICLSPGVGNLVPLGTRSKTPNWRTRVAFSLTLGTDKDVMLRLVLPERQDSDKKIAEKKPAHGWGHHHWRQGTCMVKEPPLPPPSTSRKPHPIAGINLYSSSWQQVPRSCLFERTDIKKLPQQSSCEDSALIRYEFSTVLTGDCP